ncbi:hypothetical protein C8J57DRAFT_280894 [Mycena rebaudengoi]|nr:hypothetical protein C8J57DRAFT_280894 [Mycena rebaudengoi]
MPPLTRQRTLETLQSWWSDSNRSGATVNLHAAAKPLMRRMYHQQVLAFMSADAEVPLSPMNAEIYTSYLLSNCVSSSTKNMILQHLATRAETEEDALVVQSHMFYHLFELEDWRETSLSLLDLFKSLARHENIVAETCGGLIVLLRETYGQEAHDLVWWALYLVTRVDFGVELLKSATTDRWDLVLDCPTSSTVIWHNKYTAVEAVEANVPHYAAKLLKSWFHPHIHASVWRMFAYLLLHQSTAMAILSRRPCEQLMNVLRTSIIDGAWHLNSGYVFEIFAYIARSLDGAKLVVAAAVLDHVPEGIASHDSWTRLYACELLCELAGHASTIPALVRSVSRDALIVLLSDEKLWVRECGAETLRRIDDASTKIELLGANSEAREEG